MCKFAQNIFYMKAIRYVLILFLLPVLTFAQSNDGYGDSINKLLSDSVDNVNNYGKERSAYDGYYLNAIMYKMTVHKNRRYDVQELLKANFCEKRHGIYRSIPNRFYVNRDVSEAQDGSKYKNKYNGVDLKDLVVSESFDVENLDELYDIRIGSADKLVFGSHNYFLTYGLQLTDDRVEQSDLFFHSVVGTGWTCDIDTVMFSIEFDEPLPQSALDNFTVTMGSEGSEKDCRDIVITYVDEHHISGEAYGLKPYEGLTIHMPLPEGYFDKGAPSPWIIISWIVAGLTLCVFLYIIVFELIGDRKPTKVISFYPPKDMNSAEAGCIVDGYSDDKDLLSLIPWFAYNKLLSIHYENNKITLKALGGLPNNAPDYASKLFDGFFKSGSVFKLDEAKAKFGNSWISSKSLLDTFCKNKIKPDGKNRNILLISTFLFSLLICFAQVEPDGWVTGGIMNVSLLALYALVVYSARIFEKLKFGSFSEKAKGCLFGGIKFNAIFLFAGLAISGVEYQEDYYIPREVLESLLCVQLLVLFFARRLNRMTKYRYDRLGEILGFREFIDTAEKSTLESLVIEDEHYFYRILPYAMAFGLTSKWVDKFNDFKIIPHQGFSHVDYVSMPQAFETSSLMNRVNKSTSAATAASSRSYSSSGGSYHSSSSHFGGYSGGGSGGGGGRSW